jgi:hypothetical protein
MQSFQIAARCVLLSRHDCAYYKMDFYATRIIFPELFSLGARNQRRGESGRRPQHTKSKTWKTSNKVKLQHVSPRIASLASSADGGDCRGARLEFRMRARARVDATTKDA